MKEITVTREIRRGNKRLYEEIDYFNYLTTRKERIERTKRLMEKYPKSKIFFFLNESLVLT